MRIVVFQGGLGNQLFEYVFYEYLKERTGANVKYISWCKDHNGLEIQKWFDVKLMPLSAIGNIVIKLIDYLHCHGVDLMHWMKEDSFNETYNSAIYVDYWQNKKFYTPGTIRFKSNLVLSPENQNILNYIRDTDSISIHVRRGDYLQPQVADVYGGICTEIYYKKAIELCANLFNHPLFFIFSDDKAWVKENLKIENAIYVDWNTGYNSFYDLYLMSHCKANIIANSSFSYWAARLNAGNKRVVYPKKWYNSKFSVPDIFPDDWIGL